MLVITDVRQVTQDFQNLHLCIGNFDGLHVGHRAIIEKVVKGAKAHKGTAAMMTLRPHPAYVFSPETAPKRIRSNAQMEDTLATLGLDVLFVLPFTLETSHISHGEFLNDIVLGKCQAKHLVLGHDFAFGHKALGTLAYLNAEALVRGFTVEELEPVELHGARVSSSGIRKLIQSGKLEEAEACLGAPFQIRGEVLRGRGIGGAELGFPTANLDPSEYVLPPLGIYAAEAVLINPQSQSGVPSPPPSSKSVNMIPAAIDLGTAPTIAHDKVMLEAHLLDFAGDLTGKTLEVTLRKWLRAEKKFATKEELSSAIAKDVADVRACISSQSG